MDAKSFCNFLKDQLEKECKVYENNLLSTAYETVGETKRAGGVRDALVGVASSLENVLADFYKNGGNSPFPTTPSTPEPAIAAFESD
jgi:hypothetical protein